MTVFKTDKIDHTNQLAFFGEPVNIARYENVKYSAFEKLTEKQLSFFWRPEEIELSRDGKDFKNLTDHEKHIFTSNLKRQILLDSVQGRAPSLAFLPICSLPELETWIQTWAFSETIHSRSYTHIIRNIYSDPSKIFDEMLDIPEIVECAGDISKYYDDLINICASYKYVETQIIPKGYHIYRMKRALWLCLNAVNALEGIRFYVSFACSWAFAEVKKMEGNAKIIKLIARDENIHLAATQQLLKILPKEDPDFAKIKEEAHDEVISIFDSVIEQEKAWASYLFKDGSMIGLNEKLLCDYVDWIGHKRMAAVGLNGKSMGSNPLPWTQKWISGSELQVAPQETEITSYIIGGINKDVDENTFAGFTL
jgi:ribonucleoside-diphosphate reductase beta chain